MPPAAWHKGAEAQGPKRARCRLEAKWATGPFGEERLCGSDTQSMGLCGSDTQSMGLCGSDTQSMNGYQRTAEAQGPK